MDKPKQRPGNPNFSSGPCAKRPGWTSEALNDALLGRSHRSVPGKAKLKEVIDRHRTLLGIPDDYKIGIVPASDTGAVEMAMWNLLGARGVDMLGWENFGLDWCKDATEQLKLDDCRVMKAGYGQIVDLSQVDTDRDVVFTWNGTTSGVRVPNADWIKDNRKGLTICDATSAVFAYDMPWEKLDVTTWSWQKVLGGEAAHGMLVLSPRAVERLETFVPDRPLPKIFRLTAKNKLIDGVFAGETINTPSMLAVEDCLDALKWVEQIGGLSETMRRTHINFTVIQDWVKKTDWADFLAEKPETRSWTSVCLKIREPWIDSKTEDEREAFIKSMCKLLEKEGVAKDIAGHRAAPAGLRIWCGATIEAADVKLLCPWIDWVYQFAKAEELRKAA